MSLVFFLFAFVFLYLPPRPIDLFPGGVGSMYYPIQLVDGHPVFTRSITSRFVPPKLGGGVTIDCGVLAQHGQCGHSE